MNILNGIKALTCDFLGLLKREIDFYKVRPRVATMYLTYRCNSKCKTCTMWKHSQEQELEKEIGLKEWQAIIDKLQNCGIRCVEIFGGNVLLRKELLLELVVCLHNKGFAVHIPTNQIGFDEEIAEALVKYVDTVYLSTDGIAVEQDRIRGIDGACNIGNQALGHLLDFRQKIDSALRIVCNCTVSKLNYKLLENIADYAERSGFDEIHFEYVGEFTQEVINNSRVFGMTPHPPYVRQDESVLLNREEASEIKNSLKKIKEKYKSSPFSIGSINIDALSIEHLRAGTIPHGKCYVERNEITVDPYGNMIICPFINNFVIGSLIDNPLGHVWNSSKHKDFRHVQNHGKLPMCRHCVLGVQRNPGFLKSMQRIYLSRIVPRLG